MPEKHLCSYVSCSRVNKYLSGLVTPTKSLFFVSMLSKIWQNQATLSVVRSLSQPFLVTSRNEGALCDETNNDCLGDHFFRQFSLIPPLSPFASTAIFFSSPSSRRLSDTREKYSKGNTNPPWSVYSYSKTYRTRFASCFLSWKRNFNTVLTLKNRRRHGIVYGRPNCQRVSMDMKFLSFDDKNNIAKHSWLR